MIAAPNTPDAESLIDRLLAEQRQLTAVGRFSQFHDRQQAPQLEPHYRDLIPLTAPRPGEQYAFEVNLDNCSGCKACVSACHSLNGLDEGEAWREVGALFGEAILPDARGGNRVVPLQQTITTACHHCVEPGCLLGCPVLAYEKDPATGIVRHLDDQCIGCSYCILKCPYEVPKFSKKRGIVRKCDLCHDRLAVGEAPACVQACPHEAIKITVVNQQAVMTGFRKEDSRGDHGSSKFQVPSSKEASNSKLQTTDALTSERTAIFNAGNSARHAPVQSSQSLPVRIGTWSLRFLWNLELGTWNFSFRSPDRSQWLPDTPSPAITLPTTRYVSAKSIADLRAADHFNPQPARAHWPLILMLGLTQAGIGGMLVGALAPRAEGVPMLSLLSFALLLAGMFASVFHLGQPAKAWRVWLGWRTSWLSREAIALNTFAGVTALTFAAHWLPMPALLNRLVTGGLAVFSLLALFAQTMVYADTRRQFWSLASTAPRFFGTAGVLGLALQLAFAPTPAVATALVLITLVKLAVELRVLKQLDTDAEHWTQLRRTAELQAGALRPVFGARLLLALLGGVLIPVALALGAAMPVWAWLAAALCFAGEFAERYLFFTSVSPDKMPGQP